MKTEMEVRTIELDKIRPNPFQPRESFPKEEIRELANTIKQFGLLQPISVRKKGNSYQIIAGERRWRASQFAGLKAIPAIVKDVSDSELMILSLIENVHRKDLEPMEKGRGLAEVYRLVGFEPMTVGIKLRVIDNKIRGYAQYEPGTEITKEEERIKKVADLVGLSYDYQYRLLTQLRLTPQEQKRVSELGLGYEEISSIATIEEPEVRKKVIEIAPKLKRDEIKKLSKVVKKAPELVVRAVLKPKSKVTPIVGEKLLELPEQKQKEAIKQIERLELTEEEAMDQIEAMKVEIPTPSPDVGRLAKSIGEVIDKVVRESKIAKTSERRRLLEDYMFLGSIIQAANTQRIFCAHHKGEEPLLKWSCGTPITRTYEELADRLGFKK